MSEALALSLIQSTQSQMYTFLVKDDTKTHHIDFKRYVGERLCGKSQTTNFY